MLPHAKWWKQIRWNQYPKVVKLRALLLVVGVPQLVSDSSTGDQMLNVCLHKRSRQRGGEHKHAHTCNCPMSIDWVEISCKYDANHHQLCILKPMFVCLCQLAHCPWSLWSLIFHPLWVVCHLLVEAEEGPEGVSLHVVEVAAKLPCRHAHS